MPRPHKTIEINISGMPVRVDEAIAELIKAVNTIPGIETMHSCQGDFGPGYVSFDDDGGKQSSGTSVRFLQHVIELMNIEARKRSQMEARYVAKHGLRHGTIPFSLSFTVEMGTHYVMRWAANTYPVLLKVTRRAAKQMRSVT
ncbi:MAG TPA: hypothetical protein VK578_03235 [Edaphobacter sp.]|nr:hypothetical protein [Edaphobacter sp.]